MKTTAWERHTTEEEPLAVWGPAIEDKLYHCFLWFVFLCLFGPSKLFFSKILDSNPVHHHEVLTEWEMEAWKQTKSKQLTTKSRTKSGFLDALIAF